MDHFSLDPYHLLDGSDVPLVPLRSKKNSPYSGKAPKVLVEVLQGQERLWYQVWNESNRQVNLINYNTLAIMKLSSSAGKNVSSRNKKHKEHIRHCN